MKLVAFLLLQLLVPSIALATSMQEPERASLRVSFTNGDTAEVACDTSTSMCRVLLEVNGVPFAYSAEELLGHTPLPEAIVLFSGFASDRDKYFSFHVRIECPENYKRRTSGYCYVSGLVADGAVFADVIDY